MCVLCLGFIMLCIDPFSQMTHLCPSGHFLTITIYLEDNLDVVVYGLNSVAATEYKLLVTKADIEAMFKDKPKWLKARLAPGVFIMLGFYACEVFSLSI